MYIRIYLLRALTCRYQLPTLRNHASTLSVFPTISRLAIGISELLSIFCLFHANGGQRFLKNVSTRVDFRVTIIVIRNGVISIALFCVIRGKSVYRFWSGRLFSNTIELLRLYRVVLMKNFVRFGTDVLLSISLFCREWSFLPLRIKTHGICSRMRGYIFYTCFRSSTFSGATSLAVERQYFERSVD